MKVKLWQQLSIGLKLLLSTSFFLFLFTGWKNFKIKKNADGLISKKAERCDYQHYKRSPIYEQKTDFSSLDPEFKYYKSLINNYYHYVAGVPVFLEYEKKLHTPLSKEAIILVHGNSTTPDQFFDGSVDPHGIPVYLNDAGNVLFKEGYDVYAPYVTNISRFQNATRRLASLVNDRPHDIDVKRVINLYNLIQDNYSKVHLFGTGYGGWLSISALQELKQSNNVGIALSIEGWADIKMVLSERWNETLFQDNYEMFYTRVQKNEFWEMMKRPNVYIAYSNCFEDNWKSLKEEMRVKGLENKMIFFKGTSEFRPELFLKLIK